MKNLSILVLVLMATTIFAQMPNPPGQVKGTETPVNEAYLFAHMMEGDYWRLYYSVSIDGLHWELLNGPGFQPAGNQRPDWDKYSVTPKARHGSMIPISRKQYDAIRGAFCNRAEP